MNNLAHRMTNQLEIDVRELSRRFYDERLCYLFKVPEEMQQTPCDFFGWLPNGRAVVVECKQVNRPSLPIGDKTNGLQGHQWNALELAHACEAISLLIWRRGEETRVLTWLEVRSLSLCRKSIAWPIVEPGRPWEAVFRTILVQRGPSGIDPTT